MSRLPGFYVGNNEPCRKQNRIICRINLQPVMARVCPENLENIVFYFVDFTSLPERKLVTIPNRRSRPQFHPFSREAHNVIAAYEDTSFIYAMQVSWGSAPLPYVEPGSEFPNEDRGFNHSLHRIPFLSHLSSLQSAVCLHRELSSTCQTCQMISRKAGQSLAEEKTDTLNTCIE